MEQKTLNIIEEMLNNNIDIVMYDWLTVTDSAKYQTSA